MLGPSPEQQNYLMLEAQFERVAADPHMHERFKERALMDVLLKMHSCVLEAFTRSSRSAIAVSDLFLDFLERADLGETMLAQAFKSDAGHRLQNRMHQIDAVLSLQTGQAVLVCGREI
jgi:hypothetical protein